jgi:hypothetical protein
MLLSPMGGKETKLTYPLFKLCILEPFVPLSVNLKVPVPASISNSAQGFQLA